MLPFCDWLSCSFPLGDLETVRERLLPVLDLVPCEHLLDRSTAVPSWTYRPVGGGVIRLGRQHQVGVLSASGGALPVLRSLGAYGPYLMAIGAGPHRVTRLDATVDIATDAPRVITSLAERARRGYMRVSRKAIPAAVVVTKLGLDARGALTGSVYLGSRFARVQPLVYDKRHEQECRGLPDPGPWLRYELKFKGGADPGLSLRDAWEPGPLFWHYASPDLLQAPEGVIPWTPYGEGFKVETGPELPPGARLKRMVEDSPAVDRLVQLAHECGPGGPALLRALLERRLDPARHMAQRLADHVA
jgi:hypothetical protein